MAAVHLLQTGQQRRWFHSTQLLYCSLTLLEVGIVVVNCDIIGYDSPPFCSTEYCSSSAIFYLFDHDFVAGSSKIHNNSEVLHSEFRFGAFRSFVEHQNVEFSYQRLFCKSKMMCFHFVSPSISNVLSRAPILADSNEL